MLKLLQLLRGRADSEIRQAGCKMASFVLSLAVQMGQHRVCYFMRLHVAQPDGSLLPESLMECVNFPTRIQIPQGQRLGQFSLLMPPKPPR